MRFKQPIYFVRRKLSDSRPVLVYQMWPMEIRRYGQSQMRMLLQHDTALPVGPDDHPGSFHPGWASNSRFDRFYRREKGTVDAEQDGSLRGSIPFPGNYLWGATIHAWPVNGAFWLL